MMWSVLDYWPHEEQGGQTLRPLQWSNSLFYGHMIHWIRDTESKTRHGAFKGCRSVGRGERLSRRALVLVTATLVNLNICHIYFHFIVNWLQS